MWRWWLVVWLGAVALISLLETTSAFSEAAVLDLRIGEDEIRALSRARGFCLGQDFSLRRIEKTYPDLRNRVRLAEAEFKVSPLDAACSGVRDLLRDVFSQMWPEFDAKMTTEIRRLSENPFSRQDAEGFLSSIKSRTMGEIETPIIETLLWAAPRFRERPVDELNRGYKQGFRTKSHPKAKGLDFQIELPRSWSANEGVRPNIIKKFVSHNGHGPVHLVLVVRDMLAEAQDSVSDQEMAYVQTKEGAKDLLVDLIADGGAALMRAAGFQDARDVKTNAIVIDGWPGVVIAGSGEQQRVDLTVTAYYKVYVVLYKNYLTMVQFMVYRWPWDDSSTYAQRIQRYDPVFGWIANSVVIQNQYRGK